MALSNPCADALVEILNLCEQTLTALREHEERHITAPLADKYRHSRLQKRANIVRQFVLIQGGLSSEVRQSSAG